MTKHRLIQLNSDELAELLKRFRHHVDNINSGDVQKTKTGTVGMRLLAADLLAILITLENKPLNDDVRRCIYDNH